MKAALDYCSVSGGMSLATQKSPAASSASAQLLLQDLLRNSLIRAIDWNRLPTSLRDELTSYVDPQKLSSRLVDEKLLTEYQADRILAGKIYGLILGNYRVLNRLGAGGMGVVFKAEHLRLPRLVAIKVLALSADQDSLLLPRFLAEMWAAAQLQHQNIVSAIDSGETSPSDSDSSILHYFVMEYVAGHDLEHHVQTNGPFSPIQACDVIHQIACALGEAQKHRLVHRDIKPSNILLTAEGQAKLLDFGLARHFGNRLTQPGMVLGTLDYVAPEQVRDASAVDIRADIYGLGGTLFWCLTGRTPFVSTRNALQDLTCRLTQSPPSVRAWRPEIPAGLDAVVSRMLAPNREDRYASPDALMRALLPFLEPESCDISLLSTGEAASDYRVLLAARPVTTNSRVQQVLIVDDESDSRSLCRLALHAEGIACDEAENGALALEALHTKRYDLVVSDIDMPEMNGPELLRRLRQSPPAAHLKVVMFSGRASADEMAQMLAAGADDYLTKPLSPMQLTSRVKAALRLKNAQERSDLLNGNLLALNHQLEQNLTARDSDLIHARNALVLALAELVAYRDTETGAHLMRLQRYSRCLAEEAAGFPKFAAQIDEHFIQMLECCAPLHDIGKVGLPDNILLKPGKLDPDERVLMQTHTLMGAETLRKVVERHGFAVSFFQMAIDIARHHHEHYDGKGYPDRLMGEDIPLAARIVAIGDVYDALRSRRPYKPSLSHNATMHLILEGSPGHFDPLLVEAFRRCASRIERITQEVSD